MALVTIKMMIIAEQIIILMIITITIVAVTGATIVDICYKYFRFIWHIYFNDSNTIYLNGLYCISK